MVTSGVARRYARAVFEIGRDGHDLDGWLRNLRVIRDVFEDPTLRAFLENPAIPTEQKIHMIQATLGQLPEKARNFAILLVQTRRTALIGDVVAAYEEDLNQLRGIVHAQVTTAVPLNDQTESELEKRLSQLTGARQVIMQTTVNPSILGGFVARVGDRLIDASVVGRLDALRESLMA
jgi:F-type H+-transporting ATPase subunit delta